MSTWKRPESVPFPSIWSRFDGRKEINGKIPKFWIQDVPEDMFDVAVDTMCANFILEEPLCHYSNLIDDHESVEEIRQCWKKLLDHKLALMCFMENPDGSPIIAGMNMTFAASKGDESVEYKGKKWVKVLSVVERLTKMKDPYELIGSHIYMSAFGLTVLPQFRGQGVGLELLKARTEICKAVGLTATLTVFTAIASQTLAAKCGFKDFSVIQYDDLEKIDASFVFPGITNHSKAVKFMYKIF